jgi:hypothetical protein
MRMSLAANAVATVVVALVTGCSGSNTASAPTPSGKSSATTPSTSSTAAAPTAEQTAWAGQVCTATATLKNDAKGLATAATSGGNDSAKLTSQMTVIKTSVNTLATTIKSVPAGSESDPGLAAIKASADEFTTSVNAVESSVAALEGTSGQAKAMGLATVASAASTAASKLGALGQAIETAAKDGKSTLGQAFTAAPSCVSLKAS